MDPLHFEGNLRSLAAELASPVEGFFGPRSALWQVSREMVVYLGGVRALLMQIAHPKVAQGVADHSQFRKNPIRRTYHTLRAVQDVIFGDAETAVRAAAGISAIHEQVRGELPGSTAGVRDLSYAATDPHLLFWVYATLVDTLIFAHDAWLHPLGEARWQTVYQESKRFALLFGIPPDLLPPALGDFRRWMAATLESEHISVTKTAREIARAILKAPVLAFWPINLALAAGTLPPRLRAAYELEEPLLEALYAVGARTARFVVPRLPSALRTLPAARRAERRIQRSTPSDNALLPR